MPISEWTPTTADIAALLRARTRDASGAELCEFSADTRPTKEQVASVVQRAAEEISGRIGDEVPASKHGLARSAVAYLAAYLIEISYYPEQAAEGRSPADHLERKYREAVQAIEHAAGRGAQIGAVSVATSPPWVAK